MDSGDSSDSDLGDLNAFLEVRETAFDLWFFFLVKKWYLMHSYLFRKLWCP